MQSKKRSKGLAMEKNYITCGYSSVGKSHEDKGIKCQDSCNYKTKDNIVVAAIADGVSSSKQSDVASRIAVDFVVEYCLANLKNDYTDEAIIAIIKKSFEGALIEIKKKSINAPNDYDTTLTVSVLIEDNLYYGQIGDSGIVALLEDGRYERVTEAQNGEGIGKDRPVYPLAAVSKWEFKKYNTKVKAIFMATDGVLNHIQPPLLENETYKLDHQYLYFVFKKLSSLENRDAEIWIKNEVEQMDPNEVDSDDKTLVVVINKNSNLNEQSEEYYNYPSEEHWRELLKKHEEILYPYRKVEKTIPIENTEKNVKKFASKKEEQILSIESSNDYAKKETDIELPRKPKNNQISTKSNSIKKKENKSNDILLFILGFLFGILVSLIIYIILSFIRF